MVASLARRFGDLDLAEEMAAEAFAVALERWPADGVPPNPGGWITTTANRRAIDRLRRESRRDDKQQEAWMLQDDTPAAPLGAIDDDRLRLVFTCCHPALSTEARVALTLRLVGGLTVREIASAFLVSEAAVGQRITRAKAKIASAGIPYRVPAAQDLPGRVGDALTVLFLVFNEGYLSSDPAGAAVRSDLTAEAIRLTQLVRELLPEDGEVAGLLALMLLTEARRPARLSATGELVTLDVQDRGAWDADLLAEGHALVRARLTAVAAGGAAPGRFQLLAAINAVHTSVRDVRDTDWSQVVALYDRLVRLDPSPSSRSTGRSRSPSSTARRWRWRWSTGCRSTATTRSTPPGPTCCVASAARARRGLRTRRPSRRRATAPRLRPWRAGATSSGRDVSGR